MQQIATGSGKRAEVPPWIGGSEETFCNRGDVHNAYG
jgi:hypothetical protein